MLRRDFVIVFLSLVLCFLIAGCAEQVSEDDPILDPPPNPTDTTVMYGGGSIVVSWIPSVSNNVEGYRVYTKSRPGAPFELDKDAKNATSVRLSGVPHELKITAYDKRNNETDGNTFKVYIFDRFIYFDRFMYYNACQVFGNTLKSSRHFLDRDRSGRLLGFIDRITDQVESLLVLYDSITYFLSNAEHRGRVSSYSVWVKDMTVDEVERIIVRDASDPTYNSFNQVTGYHEIIWEGELELDESVNPIAVKHKEHRKILADVVWSDREYDRKTGIFSGAIIKVDGTEEYKLSRSPDSSTVVVKHLS